MDLFPEEDFATMGAGAEIVCTLQSTTLQCNTWRARWVLRALKVQFDSDYSGEGGAQSFFFFCKSWYLAELKSQNATN